MQNHPAQSMRTIAVALLCMLTCLAMTAAPAIAQTQDDLASLSDTFDDAATLKQWQRVYEAEKSRANQLAKFDINTAHAGQMVMVPHASVWYQDYRGVLAYKQVTGDFVMTTRMHVSGRDGKNPPRSSFSLAGIMLRTPRDVTPQTWRQGGENYVFLSAGAADRSGSWQLEVKTTQDSRSQLETSSGQPSVTLRAARIGAHLILLYKFDDGQWVIRKRYHRPDMPAKIQAGLTCYTDWNTCKNMQPAQHNQTVIRNGSPDLIARFDHVTFARPALPENLKNANWSDPGQVDDATVLRVLGE